MNWRQAWWPLVLSLSSMVVLVGLVSFLSIREGRSTITVPVPVEQKSGVREFPSDFGRLSGLVPLAGGVAPVGESVAPEAHAPEFRDAAWVRAQSPDTFTIQVLAVRDEGAVKRFLAGREDRSEFVYFVYPEAKGAWYVLTTGRYASAELAAGIAQEREFGGLATQPFPRRMGAYQEALMQSQGSQD